MYSTQSIQFTDEGSDVRRNNSRIRFRETSGEEYKVGDGDRVSDRPMRGRL